MDILNHAPPAPTRPQPMTQALADAIEAGAAMLRDREFFAVERMLAEEMA